MRFVSEEGGCVEVQGCVEKQAEEHLTTVRKPATDDRAGVVKRNQLGEETDAQVVEVPADAVGVDDGGPKGLKLAVGEVARDRAGLARAVEEDDECVRVALDFHPCAGAAAGFH